MVRLGDVVEDVRWQSFVGRTAELASFDDALAGRSARRVLFVHGPGGVGKTTLLLHLCSRARRTGRRAVYLDGRDLDPSPEGLVRGVQAAGGAGAGDAPVLLVDGYEQLTPIDGWLRRDLIPSLPADGVVVLAGRDPPASAWRTDWAGASWSPCTLWATWMTATAPPCWSGPASRSRTESRSCGLAVATRWRSPCSPTRR
jgi:hypothetical protein